VETVLYEVRRGGAWITLHRPDKLNALDRATVGQVAAACLRAGEDPSVHVLVLTGSGERAFAAGADIQEMAGLQPAEAQVFATYLQSCLETLERSPKPVLAAVNGVALGGGCELALACHLRLAAEHARFGQPEINLGLIPGAGGTQRLQRVVGRGRALELILSGRIIDAAEALRIGLVHEVVKGEELTAATERLVEQLASKSPLALRRALEAVLVGGESALGEGLRTEAALFGLCFATEDMREGTRAFLEKRKPTFRGR
jgi:enoyl-CoA hydratase